ncbi:MAG: cytochrome c [Planctomycetota bacterium]|nr:cytochrome c [Planctomycetota bacterium]
MAEADPRHTHQLDQQQEIDVAALHEPILRELRDPQDGHEPIPMFMLMLFAGLIFWGGYYLAAYSGGFRSDVLNPDPAAQFAGGSAAPKVVDPLVLGEKLFKANCVSCHQASGQGVPGQYPPLAGSEWVLGPDYRLKRILLKGLEGPVSVKGATYNGNMPAFEAKFNDEKLAAVLSFIRHGWENGAPPVSPESAAATRAAVKDRGQPWKAEELLALEKDDLATPAEGAPAPEGAKTEPAAKTEAGKTP